MKQIPLLAWFDTAFLALLLVMACSFSGQLMIAGLVYAVWRFKDLSKKY